MSGEADAIILAADVGGTKTSFGVFRAAADGPQVVRHETVPSDARLAFDDVVARFLSTTPAAQPRVACFAVAGPVIAGRAAMTNHPWVLDAARLASRLGGAATRLVNDLEAAAVGMLHLPADRLFELAPGAGAGRTGNVAVVAPGTGLGCASLSWDGRRHHPIASEGGHADFAPRDEREIALWRHLRERHGHVSWERVLSGPGLAAVYGFLRDSGAHAESPAVRDRIAHEDPAAVITETALGGGDPLCTEAVDVFVRVLGAKAGNLALEVLALGGVFLGGGMVPRLLPKLAEGAFVRAFVDKGRQRALLERVAVHVSLEPDAALFGAARLAWETR
jgi:glucokinase